jgi:hypothetical protein
MNLTKKEEESRLKPLTGCRSVTLQVNLLTLLKELTRRLKINLFLFIILRTFLCLRMKSIKLKKSQVSQ